MASNLKLRPGLRLRRPSWSASQRDPRSLQHISDTVLPRVQRRPAAVEGARPLSGAALPFRVVRPAELRAVLRARLQIRETSRKMIPAENLAEEEVV